MTDVRQATWHYLSAHSWYYALAIIILAVGVGLSLVTLVPHFFIFSLVAVFLMYLFIANKMRGYLMQQFAQSLGYTYSDQGDINSVRGSLFSIGHSMNMKDVISGTDKGRPVRIFLYNYTVGYGKNSHTYSYTVLENTFSGVMPHILLHKKEFFLFETPDDFTNFSGSEPLSLEGDFNKYFSLYVEKEFEMEAYEIFTPDVMEELIETSKTLCFEFFQNKLFIYTPKFINKRAELDAMFALSDKLCSELEPVINSMKEDVKAQKELLNK